MTVQCNNNNLNYLIDPTFAKVNRLLALLIERIEENNVKKDHRDSFSHYFVPNVEIKDFKVLIGWKSFFDLPVKNKEETSKKIIEMSRKNDCTTGNLLDFAYFKENYRLVAIDLSKQTNLKDPQQIKFIGKLENQALGAIMFHHWKIRRNYLWIFTKFWSYHIIMETQKIVNLLNSSENEYPKFATKKWYVIDSESKGVYSHENPIKFLTSLLESSLCDYSDAYVSVRKNIAVVGANNNTKVAFINCTPFRKCRTEINGTFIDEAQYCNAYVQFDWIQW